MTEKKALRAQELRGLEIAIRSAKFRRQEFPIPCGLPEEIYPQLMEVIRAYAASLADSPSPTPELSHRTEANILAALMDSLIAQKCPDSVSGYAIMDAIRPFIPRRADSPSGTAAETKEVSWSYSGNEDGDFVIWENHNFVANVGSAPFVELPPTQVAFDADKAHAELIVQAVNSYLSGPSLREKEPEWISVKERLPEIISHWGPNDCYGGSVDVLAFNGKVCTAVRYSSNTWASADEGSKLERVTHWMPLPAPPKTEAGK